MIRSLVRPGTAAMLTLSLLFTMGVSPLLAAEGAVLSGRVLNADGVTPRSGVVVLLVDLQERLEYRSSSTSGEGAFKATAPAGDYALLVETEAGAFLASDRLTLLPDGNRPLALTLQETSGEQITAPGWAQQSSDMPLWAKISIAGVIAVAALVIIDEVTSDSERNATDF